MRLHIIKLLTLSDEEVPQNVKEASTITTSVQFSPERSLGIDHFLGSYSTFEYGVPCGGNKANIQRVSKHCSLLLLLSNSSNLVSTIACV